MHPSYPRPTFADTGRFLRRRRLPVPALSFPAVKVLVTGGHGFVGSHLVAALVRRGAQVRCLVRRAVQARFEGSEAVEWVSGDLRSGLGLAAALKGCEQVFHLAGLTRSLTRREMRETNTLGTARLLGAAKVAGFRGRLLFCSSLAAVGPAPSREPLTEEAPLRPMGWYGESKRDAEALLLRGAWPFEVVVVRPPAVYGERDRDFLQLFQSVERGLALLPADPGDRISLIHAEDLAEAFLAAAGPRGRAGGVYFATGPKVVSLAQILEAAQVAVGRSARAWRVPAGALRLLGRCVDLGTQLLGRASLLGSERLQEVGARHWVCTAQRLIQDTGWEPRVDLEAGFTRTVAWYRAQGRLRPARAGARRPGAG